MNEMEQKVLKTLSHQYKTQAAASTEIINLQSILNLPKGTEHFLTDIHGEYEQFNHVLKNGSGSVRRKIDEEFGNTISSKDKKSLATLIYYPESKLEIVEREEDNLEDWYKISLHRLVQVIKRVSSKYTRSKVRKALPKDFAYVIEELITEKEEIQDKEAYYNEIIHSVIRTGRAPELIIALCNLIRRLVVDHLHVVGDIFDIARNINADCCARIGCTCYKNIPVKKMADTHNRYFLRLHVEDRCGVLAEMTAVFAKYHVSVAQIIQKETKAGESAEVVVITGKVREGDFRTAMEELSGRNSVHKISSMLRVYGE